MTTLQRLRELTPIRPLRFAEALRVAELQAAHFLRLSELTDGPVPDTLITELPRLQVERLPLHRGCSGFSQWAKGRWVVVLNAHEPRTRQRFSLAHEFKHVLDSPLVAALYPADQPAMAELVCDHFAACLLMPRPWIVRAWANGTQDPQALARRFQVSVEAMEIRLDRLGLTERRTTRHGVPLARQGVQA